MEEWKQIQDYPNYSISSFGNVRNDKTNKILKPYNNNKGYFVVSLSKKGIVKDFPNHRLVGTHFLPNWNNFKEIDHKNNITTDNRIYNLRWCNRSLNNRNTRKRNSCVSNYKGVDFVKKDNIWRCRISINNTRINVGSFETEKEAGLAYNNYIVNNNLTHFILNKLV